MTFDAHDEAIATFLAGYPPQMATICQRLRAQVAQVAQTAPDAHEVLVARHNHIVYSPSARPGWRIAYICPLREWAPLGLDYGGALDDPAGLLICEGQRMRHVKARMLEQAEAPELARLLAAGWAAGEAAVAARAGG
ncbi:MAG TPA: hypothetical protein VHI51_00705 [Ktedonobacterales bacterium]|nr:hypothetical protein [Ktedonobacterales bacterium]